MDDDFEEKLKELVQKINSYVNQKPKIYFKMEARRAIEAHNDEMKILQDFDYLKV